MRWVVTYLSWASLAVGKVYFHEKFDDDWEKRWVKSKIKHDKDTGDFVLSAGRFFKNFSEDKGIMSSKDKSYYTMSAAFEPFTNENKTLYIQFQVKLNQEPGCAGAYLKFGPPMQDQFEFGHPTPYNFMFGPDQCGWHRRTHLIFHSRGQNVMKRHDMNFKQSEININRLYRLILRPNNSVRVEVDEKKLYDGSIKKDWEVLEPRYLHDPTDFKPFDWHDEPMMDDPESFEPDDWVEEERIANPAAKPPLDWDEEEDGVWIRPMMDNPNFKGDWQVHRIFNPEYDGFWEPRKIPNPKFVDNAYLYNYSFGYVGIDWWQIRHGSIIDNIIIADDQADVDAVLPNFRSLQKVEYNLRDEEVMRQYKKLGDEEEDYDDDLSAYDDKASVEDL